MESFTKRFKNIIRDNPDCLNSASSLERVLKENFPQEKARVNILLEAYEAGAMRLRSENGAANGRLKSELQDKLIEEYGRSEEQAYWAVNVFSETLESVRVNNNAYSAPIRNTNSNQTTIQTSSRNSTRNSTQNSEVNELRANYQAIFGSNAVWTVYRPYREPNLGIMMGKTEVNVDDAQKRLILQKLGLRGYDENRLVHVEAFEDRSAAWAFTDDGFYVMGKISLKSGKFEPLIMNGYGDYENEGPTIFSHGSGSVQSILYKDIQSVARPYAAGYCHPTEEEENHLEITNKSGQIYTFADTSGLTDKDFDDSYAIDDVPGFEKAIGRRISINNPITFDESRGDIGSWELEEQLNKFGRRMKNESKIPKIAEFLELAKN